MFKLAISYITKMKKNTFICVSGIAISMILLFSLVQLGSMIMESYREMMTSNSNYDLVVEHLDAKKMQKIYNQYKDKYKISVMNFFATYYETDILQHQVIGVDGKWMTTLQITLKKGKLPQNLYDIVVEESYAREHKVDIGDSLKMKLTGDNGDVEQTFHISGIVSDTAAYTSGSYMFVKMSTVKKILAENKLQDKDSGYVVYFLIDVHDYPEKEIFQVKQYLFKNYGKDIYSNIKDNSTKYELYYNDKSTFYGMNLAIKGIIAFITITMIIFIYYMMHINLQGKYRQYGIIRAIGAKRSVISKLMAYELILYGMIGLLPGCVGGVLVNKLFGERLIALLLGKKVTVTNEITGQMIIYISLLVAVSIFSVWLIFTFKFRRKSPMEMIQKREVYSEKKCYKPHNIYVDLIVNNCFRNKKNSRALLVTMTLASIMTIVFINGARSVSFDVNHSIFAFSDYEVAVALDDLEKPYFSKDQLQMLADKTEAIFKQCTLGLLYDVHVYSGNDEIKDCGVIIYSNNMMEQLRKINKLRDTTKVVAFGDKLRHLEKLDIFINGKKTPVGVDAQIAGEWSSLVGERAGNYTNAILVDEDYAREKFEFAEEWNDILLKGNIEGTQLKNILGKQYYEYLDLKSVIGQANSQMKSFLVLIAYMACSIIFLTVFLIRSIVKESFAHRKKEIGTMCAIGTKRKQMLVILMGEVLLLVLLAEFIAAGISVPISMYVYQIMNDKTGMQWEGFVFGIPLIIILSGIVIWLNVRACMKEKITDLLKCEE